jgi:UDP-N-acetyl-D-glucosamine dehydrogenase
MNVAVIGLGKIGLPLAVQYARKGNRVFGVDINDETVKQVNLGMEPFPGEKNLDFYLKEVVEKKCLSATSDFELALESAEVIVIAIPLLIDEFNMPDFKILDDVSQSIGLCIRKGALVILETTVPIGTTRGRLAVNIEKHSSLKAGKDFFAAFSPERVLTGRIFEDLKRYPKLVGGINEESSMCAKEFYEKVLEFDERSDLERKNGVWIMKSAEAAEFAKLAETTYRDVNIALANQFAKHASQLNLDIREVIEASNSQPFSHIHTPGIWVGGHCIPVYPHLYRHTDVDAEIVNLARQVNTSMVPYAIQKIKNEIGTLSEQRCLVLGVSYRAGVKETAHSGVFELFDKLGEQNILVETFDPNYTEEEIKKLGLIPFSFSDQPDIIIVQTAQKEFLDLDPSLFRGARVILDGRGLFYKNRFFGENVIQI